MVGFSHDAPRPSRSSLSTEARATASRSSPPPAATDAPAPTTVRTRPAGLGASRHAQQHPSARRPTHITRQARAGTLQSRTVASHVPPILNLRLDGRARRKFRRFGSTRHRSCCAYTGDTGTSDQRTIEQPKHNLTLQRPPRTMRPLEQLRVLLLGQPQIDIRHSTTMTPLAPKSNKVAPRK